MIQEKDPEIIEIRGLRLIRYCDAAAQSLRADLYLTREMYGRYWGDYATQVPRFRPQYPTQAEFANEAFEYILASAWPNGLPEDVRDLMSKTRVCAFNGHGNQYDDIGWGAHIQDGKRLPIRALLDHYQSSGYETMFFAVCNPNREHLEPQRSSVIYPVGMFGINPDDFEMVVKRCPIQAPPI